MTHKYLNAVLASFVLALIAATPALAQTKYTIKEMTPEVKEALEDRRQRYDRLQDFKSKGIIGENNRGYVEVLQGNGQAASLVNEENADRRVIYQTIAAQNNLSRDAVSVIEEVFAQVQREKANPGDRIQTEAGQWVTK